MDGLFWLAAAAVALSGFFSLCSHALRDVSRRDLARRLPRHRQRVDAVLSNIRPLQATCALLRSVSNLAILLALLLMFERTLGHTVTAALAAVGVSALLIAVFGLGIPHAWARYAAGRIVAATAPILLALRWVLWPIVWVMLAFDVPIRRLTGAGEEQVEEIKEELLRVATEAHAEGAVAEEEMDMIESAIEFGARTAGEIMTPRTDIVAIPIDLAADQLRQTVVDAGHTRLPVYDGDVDNIIGILHVKDLLAWPSIDQIQLRKIMRKPFFVPESKRLDDLLREFKALKSHLAVVLDEYGGTAGLITVEDLVEEIVGEIADEYDRPVSALIKRLDDRTAEVDGRCRIEDLNDAMGLKLPEEADYDTVAGFVFSELGFIPPVGETLTSHGATCTVMAADARKITRLRVEKTEQAGKGQ